MSKMLSPFVYWAQSESCIFIKVDLKDVSNTYVDIKEQQLTFEAKGMGAKGMHNYGFTLDFVNEINTEESAYKVHDYKVDFILTKKEKGWWSRLTAQILKPAWLKIDFDRWQSEDQDEINEEEARDVREDYPDLYDKLQKEEIGYKKENILKVYLVLYNFFCYCGFLYITSIMGLMFLKHGVDSFPRAYEAVGYSMKLMILMQIGEFFHCLFGFTKSSVFTAFMQVLGRTLVMFTLVVPEPRIQEHSICFHLFMVWSTIEVVRYPYYITQVFKKENAFLTWLRYTIWIPLYPLGFIAEGIIIYKNIMYLDENQRFSLSMPNAINFTFHYATFLRIYLLMFMIPAMYSLMSYMYKARSKKLSKLSLFGKKSKIH